MTAISQNAADNVGQTSVLSVRSCRVPFGFGRGVFSPPHAAALVLVFSLLVAVLPACAETNLCNKGMVASVHPLATDAGLTVLKSGGNAIDAAVAVGLTLGVVDGANSGIGGGCFLLIRLANGRIVAIDGRETAPIAATRDMFLREGKADTRLSQTGALASGVPGELAAFDYAVRKFGSRKLASLILPVAGIAEKGFVVSENYAKRIKSVADELSQFNASRAVFFRDGKPLGKGDCLKQPDLAATYRAIAGQGINWFYRGSFARAVDDWMKANGGLMTVADLEAYHIVLREPVATTYRGCRVVSFPPPSSGGVHLIQMLNLLERFDLQAMDESSRYHVMAETMKLAFADRAHWLGDPAFTKVPRGLVSPKYAAALAQGIQMERSTAVLSHGQPPNWEKDYFEKHTTHFSVADDAGNWVACTATVNTTFGSKVVIPGTGVVMNNQMDDFSIQPGVANYFGLVGAEANAIAPGKRPLSSMCPTIVFKGRQPIIALGAAGGPRIITTVLQELVAMLDFGKTPAEALAEPRFHHQWSPDELVVEPAFPGASRAALTARGHRLKEEKALSVSQAVARSADGRSFVGAADPRAEGNASGW